MDKSTKDDGFKTRDGYKARRPKDQTLCSRVNGSMITQKKKENSNTLMGMCTQVSMEGALNMGKEKWSMQIRMSMMAFGTMINNRRGLLQKPNKSEIEIIIII